MNKLAFLLLLFIFLLTFASPALASNTPSEIANYTTNTLQIITLIASGAAGFFLIKAGYLFMTSTGKPDTLNSAKKTFRNALIGLTLILGANLIVSIFQGALTPPATSTTVIPIEVAQTELQPPDDGLVKVLVEAIVGFVQYLLQSSISPIVNAVFSYLTTTPSVYNNEVIYKFWLISLGIVDSLFVVAVALLGLQLMSADTFGFEELELRQLLPRIGIAFLGANISLFLTDYIIMTCNTLVEAVLNNTGGLGYAWIIDAASPASLFSGSTPLVMLLFLLLFLVITIVLWFMYISRLIMIALGAALSPFIFLLWLLPKTSSIAEIAVKSYIGTVFIVFVHVVIIQLAGSFLATPSHAENSIASIAVAIGLFFTLLKVPSMMMQFMFYSSGAQAMRKVSNQIINVLTTNNASTETRLAATNQAVKAVPKIKQV